MNGTLTDVAGLRAGHSTDTEAATGRTVAPCVDGGATSRAGVPALRDLDVEGVR